MMRRLTQTARRQWSRHYCLAGKRQRDAERGVRHEPTAEFGKPRSGLPVIASRITIEGKRCHRSSRQAGATRVRSHARAAGKFFLLGMPPRPGDCVTLQSVTLSGGSSFGGLLNSGTASIKDSIISGNTGFRGVSNSGTLTIENSTILGNTSNYGGGGVSNDGALTITNSTISANTARFNGGGIYNYGGRVTITNSTISGNSANRGGGVFNTSSFYYQNYGTLYPQQ